MCWNRVSAKSSQMAAVVPLPITICIIFRFLFHSINQLQWDITIITTEIYSTRISFSDAYLHAKWYICWNVNFLGKKQLLLLHALVFQIKDLSLFPVYTAFLIYTPILFICFSHDGYTMGVSGTLWLALSCSLYIWGLTDHTYAVKISWVQGWSHQEQYTDYLRANQSGWAQAQPPAQPAIENHYTIEHTQLACYTSPAATGRWKDAREKVERTFLVQSSLHIVPTSFPCTSFLGNIYVMSLCSRREICR